MCCGFKPLHAILAMGTVLVWAFDVATNWFAFARFMEAKTNDSVDYYTSVFVGCAASLGSVIWIIAIRNMVYACKACGADDAEEAQESVGRWEESTAFFQLILQDSAMALLIYITFRMASCTLYLNLFEWSVTAELALIGALSGSVWKVAVGLINCFCCCCTKASTGCGWACFCCICRLISGILAAGILGFVAYQLCTINGIGFENRNECLNGTTVAP